MTEVSLLENIESRDIIQELPIRLSDLGSGDAVNRTHTVAPQAIGETEQPGGGNRISSDRVTIPPARSITVEKVAFKVGISLEKPMPDLAMSVIHVALGREVYGSEKLKVLAKEVREQLADVDLLLDLSGELTALPDKDSHDVSDKMRDLFGKLEAHKIQIWKGDGKMSKEKLGEMKAQIGSQIDKLRTAIQTKISTEIQPETNNLQSIMNIVQQIIQSDARLKRKTTEIPR